jgi:hypothetical protein
VSSPGHDLDALEEQIDGGPGQSSHAADMAVTSPGQARR